MATQFAAAAAALLVPLIFALLTAKAPPLATAASINDPPLPLPPPVLTAGSSEPLLRGVKYYIVSAIRGAGGGGLKLAPVRNESCPLDVVQEQSDLRRGLPVTFSPLNPAEGQIRESSLLNIKFAASTSCGESTVWRVVKDEQYQQWVVTTGGIEGITIKSSASLFKIEKSNVRYGYKIVYCSWPIIADKCEDVGLYFNRGIRGLALSDEPFRAVFFRDP